MLSFITEISWRKRSDSAVTLLVEGQIQLAIEAGQEMLAGCLTGLIDDTAVFLRFGGDTIPGSGY
jgi:hypothetical protein